MKQKFFYLCLLNLIALISISNAQGQTFCWRDTTTRGAGTVPLICGPNQQLIGLLCYDRCPAGYSRFGFDCHQNCLGGWTNNGLFCRLAEYGRGAGYSWQISDGFSNQGMLRRCRANNPGNDCEMWGAVAYPKCRTGYSFFGCCICRPAVPNCVALGFNAGIDLSCAKKIIIGSPKQGSCKAGEEKNGLLCYPICPANYQGVGPVCWGQPPKGWVESWVKCGMGAAKSDFECGKTIVNQITSVGTVVMNIATLGTAGSATIAEKQATKLPQLLSKLQPLVNQAKDLWSKSEPFRNLASDAAKVASKAYTANSVITKLSGNVSGLSAAQIVSLGAEIASLFDPTGIASLVKAYSYNICSKIVVP